MPTMTPTIATVTTDNAALVSDLCDAIVSHADAIATAPADSRPQMLAAHRAHITMTMQRLRAAHPDLATVAPLSLPRSRAKASDNFGAAVVALRASCALVTAAAAPAPVEPAPVVEPAPEPVEPAPVEAPARRSRRSR